MCLLGPFLDYPICAQKWPKNPIHFIYNRLIPLLWWYDIRIVSLFVSDCRAADLTFVLDSSGSIGQASWLKVKLYVASVVRTLPSLGPGAEQYQVALINYGNNAKLQWTFSEVTSQARLQELLNELPWKDQATNTSGAMWRLIDSTYTPASGDRPGVPNIAIVITDGESNRDSDKLEAMAADARAIPLEIFVIGVSLAVNRTELNYIGSRPLDNYVHTVSGFDALPTLTNILSDATCDAIPGNIGNYIDTTLTK